MLQTMGWKKGNGLGKNQQGNLDFIQVRYKKDATGIGFDRLKDNQWTDTEHSFNELLQNLNNSNSNSNDEDEGTKSSKKTSKSAAKSLEEMSKQSRARVHYKKFTKGKDVYKYSEKDLANIFGKKSLNESEKVVIEQVESEEDQPDHYESSSIVNTGISITDYFKQKMKKNNSDVPNVSLESEIVDQECLSSDEIKPKKKKSKPVIDVDEEQTQPDLTNEDTKVKKKKRKHEQIDKTDCVVEETKEEVKKIKVEEVESKETEGKLEPQKPIEPERLRGVNAFYSTDIIQIPTHVAQKMSKMTVDKFQRANLGNVVGYGMSEEIEIKVIQTKLGDTSLSTDKYSIYNMDKVYKPRGNPRKILSKIKKTKKSIQVI